MKIYHVTEITGKYIDWWNIPDPILAAACQRGTETHKACHCYSHLGYVIGIPESGPVSGYVQSFMHWYDANVGLTLFSEKRLTDIELGFTGQLDFIFKMNSGEIVLVDIKTPITESRTWQCQLAAYDHLVKKCLNLTVDDIMSLRLDKDGGPAKGKRYNGSRNAAFNAFLSALNAHRFING